MSCDEPPPPELLEGIAQFNRGEFFAQHETLELLWRAERRDIRYLYQGILQIGVAFHHLHRLNHHGAVYMLTRGSNYLRPFAPRCQCVDVQALLDAAAAALQEVERLGPARLAEFDWRLAPTVRLKPDTTDDRVPDTTDDRVPDTTDDRVPDTTDDRVQDTTDDRVPDTTDDRVPDTTDDRVPDTTDDRVPVTTGDRVPDTTDDRVPDTTDDGVPDKTGDRVPHTTGDKAPDTAGDKV